MAITCSRRCHGRFNMQPDWLVIQDQPKSLACINLVWDRPFEVWRSEFGTTNHAPVIAGQMLVTAATDPPLLASLDLPTGAVLWQAPLDAVPTTSPVVAREFIYVGA